MKKIRVSVGTLNDYNIIEHNTNGEETKLELTISDNWVEICEYIPQTKSQWRERVMTTRYKKDTVLRIIEFY